MNWLKNILAHKYLMQKWLAGKHGKSYLIINRYAQNRKQASLDMLFELDSKLFFEPKVLITNNQKNNL